MFSVLYVFLKACCVFVLVCDRDVFMSLDAVCELLCDGVWCSMGCCVCVFVYCVCVVCV